MSAWELTLHDLERLGREAGFDAVGATGPAPFPELAPRLEAYAERGRTGFEYEDIHLRTHPQEWMPGVKSLVSVAMAYLTSEGRRMAKQHPRTGMHGQVTVYSYGLDYHSVMEERLNRLVALVERHLGRPVRFKLAVDTSPLVDRRVAERAGIGWVGKNCMFYTPQHGSFVFLGTLLTDIDIEPNQVEQVAKCGSCSLCLDACPTGALVAPGVIDATRCLSYVTQMKGMIPEPYREAMGRRVWGCDTCQWACPENKEVASAEHKEYLPQGELAFPDLVEVLQLSNRQFQRRYGHTAAAWRGLRTWQRNALIALGNTRSVDAVGHIQPFLHSAREELRTAAAWALKRIGGQVAQQAVQDALSDETSPLVQAEMVWAREESQAGKVV